AIVPLTPEKGIEIVFTKPADGRGHLALKGLPAHFPIGHDFQASAFLERNGVVDRLIFDRFEFRGGDCPTVQLLLCVKQLRWSKQASNDVSVNSDHTTPVLFQNSPLLKWIGRGFGRRNLFQMRAFYLAYPQIVQTLSAQLPKEPQKKIQTVSGKSQTLFGCFLG